MGHSLSAEDGSGRHGHDNTKNTKQEKENDLMEDETFSSYGTTEVNILTLQEVPVVMTEQPQLMDPFAGFGPLSPSGMMNPFGSIFGGFFGHGSAFDPWNPSEENQAVQQQQQSSNRGWVRGSKSVSTSTRSGRDENGKRIMTTVKKTVVVDDEGKRRTETETVIRHLDDGGRIEKKKEIHDERQDAARAVESTTANRSSDEQRPSHAPSMTPQIAVPTNEPPKPPQVAMIAPTCRLGIAVTDTKMDSRDPNIPNMGDANKWRKTEYLVNVGRLFPTLGVVTQYYADDDQKQYDEQRQRQKKSRWDKSTERDQDKNDTTDRGFPLTPKLPDTSRTKYYLDRIEDQMVRNLKMMKLFAMEMTKRDFPKKVYYSGQKILDNMGPTAERAGKLMKDVFGMWFGGGIGWGGDDGGRRR
jgi:hypothetical protein